jgi:DisA bacterial checkpoint controller nucleotide-binding
MSQRRSYVSDENTVKYFMWGYQPYFRSSIGDKAKGVFNLLDHRLAPSVFLVGVIDNEKDGKYPVAVEPDDCKYQPDIFRGIKEQAKNLLAIDPEINTICVSSDGSHEIVQKNQYDRMRLRAIRGAISNIIHQHDKYDGKISFCSFPVKVDDYWVCVILQLEREVHQSYYYLQKSTFKDRYAISVSLIDATVSKFLDECSEALRKPDPGASFVCIDREDEEIIRSAGSFLMYTPACQGQNVYGLHGLFESCNIISSLKYEGSESIGEMIVSRKDHPNIEVVLQLRKPIWMRKYKAVRKLLEMSGRDISLLSDSACIYGLGKQIGQYDTTREDLFVIRFAKHYTWHLFHAEHEMMKVAYGQPYIPKNKIDVEKVSSDISRIFIGIKPTETKNLLKLMEESTKQKHGTILIITSNAENEAIRLANQSMPIEPIQLSPEMLGLITSIDGAIMLSPSGICYAVGVILDGLATEKGDPSRGARYNSAVRYVQDKERTLAVIVSEDGDVDLVPNLMPLLSRKLLTTKIEELENMAKSEIDVKNFNELMDWFKIHQFYCSAEICNKINSLRVICEKKFKGGFFMILLPDIHPNIEMNESYFIE